MKSDVFELPGARKEINPLKLHKELEAAGLPVEGVTSEGRLDWQRVLTKEEQDQAAAILAQHEAFDLEIARRCLYAEKGLDAGALVSALWEMLVESKPEKVQALQAIKEQADVQLRRTAGEE